MAKCYYYKLEKKKVGEKISKSEKCFGVMMCLIILIIVLIPLILLSTLNPTNFLNEVTGANTELSICFEKDKIFTNFTLFRTEHVWSISDINSQSKIFESYGYNKSPYTKNFPKEQIQIVKIPPYGDYVWNVPKDAIETITYRLEDYKNLDFSIYFNLKYSFKRPNLPESNSAFNIISYPLYVKGRVDLNDKIKIFLENIKNCTKNKLELKEFYNPAIRLTSLPSPKVIWDNNNFKNLTLTLDFKCRLDKEGKIDYTTSFFQILKYIENIDDDVNITFHTFSDKVSDISLSYTLLTFYITFIILFVGKYLRGFFTKEIDKIILTDMPKQDYILDLCQKIRQATYDKDLENEELYYCELIDLVRSSENLKGMTGSFVALYNSRKYKNN